MAWSNAARRAALEARRLHRKAVDFNGIGSKVFANTSLKARKELADAIRAQRIKLSKTAFDFNSKDNQLLRFNVHKRAVASTAARNLLRRRK